ncbi:DUF1659 domain-containing protein [Clostridium sp. YIM B02506]|uniref:DUF1659 domain-containing protein n=1 Tax=Clostridium sp. YIM B02506 TaxID=2910680 RepID=UPI001EED76A6|nr:DUF1659 domain-containing protein [Clostridium sp. YIM B02506]
MTEVILTSLALVVEYKSGLDKEGNDVYKKQRYSKISENATDESLYDVGNAIGQVLDTQTYRVSKENKFELFHV